MCCVCFETVEAIPVHCVESFTHCIWKAEWYKGQVCFISLQDFTVPLLLLSIYAGILVNFNSVS